VQYKQHSENILFGDVEIPTRIRKARQTCATAKLPFAWMRFDVFTSFKPSERLEPIKSSVDVSRFMHESIPFAGTGREHMLVLCLNARNMPLAIANPHMGGRTSATVDPVSVFRPAVIANAVAIVIAHNHPSEDPTPSSVDIELTKRLVVASKSLAISLLDHLVLTDDPSKFFSFLDKGLISHA
jgi:DNA repair protein RadC